VAVVTHAVLGLGVYALCWCLRAVDFLAGVYASGLFMFLFLRQISFAVSACQGRAGDLASYLCYLLFYPGVTGTFGGPEVWSEFSRRNLSGRTAADYPRALRSVVRGTLMIWVADRIPMSASAVFASPTPLLAWTTSFILLVKVALTGMGFWALIDACASFYGFRLRPNFEGILRCRNPSELWRSWRGSLTNWLVCHVYAPLGANRHHQSRNILAAFGVSLVWHWSGVPYVSPDFQAAHLAPITLWAAINAVAVVGHVQATRHRWRLLPDATPAAVRHAVHVFLTLCLATLSVTLPSAQLGAQERLVPFVACLVGACP
jgi:D-alanyl-lipoteichoic acid acyltransferase DltB (MBOAT superfamily)